MEIFFSTSSAVLSSTMKKRNELKFPKKKNAQLVAIPKSLAREKCDEHEKKTFFFSRVRFSFSIKVI